MSDKKQNRLAFEKSPYLLQHKENPVDWYPWGSESFEKAKRENKPIFLSIGYSTCHWCHVMAHESFEDPLVAQIMNDTFVSIKVDREERPDVDMFYMTVCQNMTGSGGWPLSIIMTPDKQPFFAGTYIPKETRFGRIGMVDLIPRIKTIWATRKTEVLNSANQITATLHQFSQQIPDSQDLGESALHLAFEELYKHFDVEYGGFGSAPKFPTPHNLLFLLRYWKRTCNQKALEMVEKTVRSMRSGGIYDQVGFGFHRYSTDRFWLVPHFEKMLYDQALLANVYLETYQATKNQEYAKTAHEILTYVLRDMSAPGGGFYSAEDADSEGEEGKYYIWSIDEIKGVLEHSEIDLCIKIFNVEEKGNFLNEAESTNKRGNILHLSKSFKQLADESDMSIPEFHQRLMSIVNKLLAYRDKRKHPSKDDKILTDWNGLMIAALAKAARILNEPSYASAAQQAIDFIMKNMLSKDGRLLHRYRDGEAAISAHIDDYSFLIQGLLELYDTTFDSNFLKIALSLNTFLLQRFWDQDKGGFYFTADDADQLPFRQKEIYDGAIPSGNSVAMLNLLRLGRITANPELEKRASQIGRAFPSILNSPSNFTQLLVAVDFAVGPNYEVVIVGDSKSEDTRKMLNTINREFIPNKVLVLIPIEISSPEIITIAPYSKELKSLNNQATAYVCSDYNCKLPTTNVETILKLFNLQT
jgi:uncharacterized protein